MLSTHFLSRRSHSSTNHRILVPGNAQCICIYRGWKMLRRGSTLRSRQLLNTISFPSNLALSAPPDNSCLRPIRMYYLLFIIATLSTNSCATVTVGMWVVLTKDCNRGSNSMFANPSCKDILHTTADILASANRIVALRKLLTQYLVNIFCKTHPVHRKTTKKIFNPRPRVHGFHLSLLKPSKPDLCKQKELVSSLKLSP